MKLTEYASQFQRKHNSSWQFTIINLLNLIQSYPGGLTHTIIETNLLKLFLPTYKNKSTENDILTLTVKQSKNGILSLKESQNMIEMILHSKYVQHQNLFTNRKLLFVNSKLNTTKIIVDDKIDLLRTFLPTESLSIILDLTVAHDLEFYKMNFGLMIEDLKLGSVSNISFRIVELPVLNQIEYEPSEYIKIKVKDTSGVAYINLWGDQIHFIKLFKKGDLVCLMNPFVDYSLFIDNDLIIELGVDTLVFLVELEDPRFDYRDHLSDIKDVDVLKTAKCDADVLKTGRCVYKMEQTADSKDMVPIKNISNKNSSIPLMGRVLLLAYPQEGAKYKLGIRIGDDTGTCDVTLTDSIAREASRKFDLGSWVLITELLFTPQSEQKTLISTSKTMIYNISGMIGIPASSCLSKLTYFHEVKPESFFYTRSCISQFEIIPANSYHIVCEKLVMVDEFSFCEVCVAFFDVCEVEVRDDYCMVLDDGLGSKECVVNPRLHGFFGVRDSEEMLGKVFHFGITVIEGLFRVDSVSLNPPIVSILGM